MAQRSQQRRKGARLGAVLTAAVALALAALSLNAAQGATSYGMGPVKSDWPLAILVVLILAFVLVGRFRAWQDRATEAGPVRERIDSLVVPGVVLAAVVTTVGLMLLGTHTPGVDEFPVQPGVMPSPSQTHGPAQAQAPVTQPGRSSGGAHLPFSLSTLLLAVLALAGIALVVALAVMVSRWVSVSSGGGQLPGTAVVVGEPQEALAEAVTAGQQALAGTDARAAIIACYAAMETSLAEGGIGRRTADTPAELLERVVLSGAVDEASVRTLTDLFREARYSTHPMAEHQRDQAAAALDTIAAELARAAAEGGISLPDASEETGKSEEAELR
ncbi:DUF4129 domain-containing protein [Streptacidiphilus fuscans]|uniref:DUF4129 domain-containing protein n=1 Tax=Streptacidiphilus fuscans TaxID=2789292 RepID=A0A931BBX1_9ACTN|nr:DUF4129 domain-containing protein [Streptacidiphilus fuscans]MBF9071393.1 DUF4129 domain-containing protein [Streptacidiphilus fuscans]